MVIVSDCSLLVVLSICLLFLLLEYFVELINCLLNAEDICMLVVLFLELKLIVLFG